ncbi:hypothetical protein EVJ58_g3839 [Rhodofomes roseus]|uniref:SUN domain-containing protein n=1 Tax=Rhodofomes roseus TaxID=34475 RepID=A0A4Y9YLV7_9APHY|nr:hypothetical protein EVJ58_g3839 [Rhodofomes roseus]
MRNTDSPYNADRFLYREDSAVWPTGDAEPPSHKLVRFASTNSVSSENAESLSAQPERQPRRGSSFPLIYIVLAFGLLALAVALQIAQGADIHMRDFLSILPNISKPYAPLTPALRQAVEEIIAEHIKAHARANRGRRDFALRAAGGRIAPDLTTGCGGWFSWGCESPSIAIDDDVRVGKCWNIRSLPAQLAIVLPEIIFPSHVTVEHLPREVAPVIGDAPRNLTLWGIVDGKSNTALFEALRHADPDSEALDRRPPHIASKHLYAPLVSFTYDIDGEDPVQTFEVSETMRAAKISFAVFVLEVHSNWGGSSTCLYRVRIHGTVV